MQDHLPNSVNGTDTYFSILKSGRDSFLTISVALSMENSPWLSLEDQETKLWKCMKILKNYLPKDRVKFHFVGEIPRRPQGKFLKTVSTPAVSQESTNY